MIKKLVIAIGLVALVGAGTTASAYDFWGISLGTDTHNGSTCLTFNGVAGAGVQGVVGGYPYTQVDGAWQGAFAAASRCKYERVPGQKRRASSPERPRHRAPMPNARQESQRD